MPLPSEFLWPSRDLNLSPSLDMCCTILALKAFLTTYLNSWQFFNPKLVGWNRWGNCRFKIGNRLENPDLWCISGLFTVFLWKCYWFPWICFLAAANWAHFSIYYWTHGTGTDMSSQVQTRISFLFHFMCWYILRALLLWTVRLCIHRDWTLSVLNFLAKYLLMFFFKKIVCVISGFCQTSDGHTPHSEIALPFFRLFRTDERIAWCNWMLRSYF